MLFLIQSKIIDGIEIPAQDFGYITIDMLQYKNWWENKNDYKFIFLSNENPQSFLKFNENKQDITPIGSIEFCLDFYKMFGIDNIKPLNIPECLWKFVKRKVYIDYCKNINGHWFLKSTNKIKCSDNGEVFFNGDGGDDKKYFLTKWTDDIISEWRLFVYNKEILGLKCYSGDEWILPDKKYCEEIVDFYDKKCYTLDIMIDKNGINDIVELHDFFACGLYGFSHPKLLNMIMETHKEILRGGKNE